MEDGLDPSKVRLKLSPPTSRSDMPVNKAKVGLRNTFSMGEY
jgi:hypothetical protein